MTGLISVKIVNMNFCWLSAYLEFRHLSNCGSNLDFMKDIILTSIWYNLSFLSVVLLSFYDLLNFRVNTDS